MRTFRRTRTSLPTFILGLRATLAAVLLLAAAAATAQQQATNSTPYGHTAYFYSPYAWAFGKFDLAPIVKKYVNAGGTDAEKITSGQQYALTEIKETAAPTDDKPAKNCTVPAFRDLLQNAKKDLGVLIVSGHGGEKSITVEPFASEAAMHKKYLEYTKPADADKKAMFSTDEIKETSNRHGWAISATDIFILNYRKIDGALVYIDACNGSSLTTAFADNAGKPGQAQIALGPNGCPSEEGSNNYAERFFSDLDGQPREGRDDLSRLEERAVGMAMAAENRVKGSVQFSKSLFAGNTTLAPRVVEERGNYAFKCPLGKGDTINLVFDTTCDAESLPDIEVEGITVGPAKWQGESKFFSHMLKIPVTGPDTPIKTYKFTLKGDKLKSGSNDATIDGNSNPAVLNKDGSGVNARGPSNSKASPDSYVVQYDDCKRVH